MEKSHGLDNGFEEIKQPENYEEKVKQRLYDTLTDDSSSPPGDDSSYSSVSKTNSLITSTKKHLYYLLYQNYELQLKALENLKSFLNQFKKDLSERMGQYNDQVFGLRQSGLEEHISDNYDENFCIPTKSSLFKIIESIELRDFPFINENIERVKEAWEAAKKVY